MIFSDTAVQEWLAANLPNWQLEKSSLVRVYKTRNWRVTLMVANAIGFVAEAANHHPELILNYPSVEVHLKTHSADGITVKDYELAQRIEEIVLWLPNSPDVLDRSVGEWIEKT
jgi:pterin-4a-carbinolamine dehydratase